MTAVASKINCEMELAAAHAIADTVDAEHRDVAPAVARAVAEAAVRTDVARKEGRP